MQVCCTVLHRWEEGGLRKGNWSWWWVRTATGILLIVMMIMWARAQQSVELSTMGLREIPQCLDKAHLANSLHLAWCLKRFFLIVKALAGTFNKENLRGLLQALWYLPSRWVDSSSNQSVTCLFVKTITRNCFPALVIIMGYLHFSTPRTQGISLWVGPWASVALRGQGRKLTQITIVQTKTVSSVEDQ